MEDSSVGGSFADPHLETALENGGPLWSTIRQQLYRSEVSAVKRLVGETFIRQNRLAWEELVSLRQILGDFQQQNDELSDGFKQQVKFCGSQHRDLLRRQAQICLEDARSQAEACGRSLNELLPDLEDQQLCDYVCPKKIQQGANEHGPPATPSTRPSSAASSRWSCASPEPGFNGTPTVATGRPLGVDELSSVAQGIRDALESEHEALLVAIVEQTEQLEAEASRRASAVGQLRCEPSTAKLQQFVHKLQELVNSPGLRTLSLTAASPQDTVGHRWLVDQSQAPIGGSSARRLKALIAERRRFSPEQNPNQESEDRFSPVRSSVNLVSVPEAFDSDSTACPPRSFDPFFDDPFT